jgi:hypothetical protein
MSNFTKPGVATNSDGLSRPLSRNQSLDPWYSESPKQSKPQSPRSPMSPNSFVAVHEEQLKLSNSLVSKRLLNNVGRLEEATNGLMSELVSCSLSVMTDDSINASAAFADLNETIAEIENLVKRLKEPSEDSECFTCVSLRCENESLKSHIMNLEKENSSYKERMDDLSTAAGKATPQSALSPEKHVGPSPLVSASMRLKSVTAALNKALHARK